MGKIFVKQVNIHVWTVVIERVRTGLVFVLPLKTILGFQYRALTWPRLQTFKTRLKNESQVGTPHSWNLNLSFILHDYHRNVLFLNHTKIIQQNFHACHRHWNVTLLIRRGSNFVFFAALYCSLLWFNGLLALLT